MLALCLFVVLLPVTALAAEATVSINISSAAEANGEAVVPVSITSDTDIGTYLVLLEYDTSRLTYLSGADENGNGRILLSGTAVGSSVQYTLRFQVLSGGSAGLAVRAASIYPVIGDTPLSTYFEGAVYLNLSGEDTGDNSFRTRAEFSNIAAQTGIPLIGALTLNGDDYYLIDLSSRIPEEVKWQYKTISGTYDGIGLTFLTDSSENTRLLYMLGEDLEAVCFAAAPDGSLYLVNSQVDNRGASYLGVPAPACMKIPKEIQEIPGYERSIVYAIASDGTGFYGYADSRGRVVKWEEGAEVPVVDSEETSGNRDILYIILAVLLILVVGAVFYLVYIKTRDSRRKKSIQNARRKNSGQLRTANNKTAENKTEEKAAPSKDINWWEVRPTEKVVISIQDVSMKFKVATSNVSGIKDYVVQFLKRKVKHKEFTALNHVSFDVHKGDVIGIIGTNGSGKSTLLKIVSGALKPTSGKVRMDKSKIQLLTIGTGFDPELTARENLYLNGSIIGYSKEFLDTHYDEIVEFAELENFMDEKVKNFSSGMVSRLGFAIATVANAAEILILDEVLAVGDEFFRKKSLNRVREMIHSGSTVLIVSHNIGTILENCTKVVWLEKSRLKMIGDVEVVCHAYRESGYLES